MAHLIMVVDDELDLEMLITQKFRRQIRNNEYEFAFAHNGLEALNLLSEKAETHLILSDINMPEMDGLTLLSRLAELKLPTLETVIVSAYGDMENIRTAMNRGAFDFVTKPIAFDDLEKTITKTLDHIERLRKSLVEHDQLISIRQDLNTARTIQQSLLPKVFPPFPDRTEFDIFASMNAAKDVGGDFYDFFFIDKDRLGVVIADVSGKGVPAALFMAISRTLIKATAMKGMPASECVEYANNLLCRESIDCMFVTAFYGILNTKTGEFEYANGGHNPPYIVQNDGTLKKVEMTGGLALALMDEYKFKSKTVTLQPGDTLYLYTDGVTEAMSVSGEQFTEKRLEDSLIKTHGEPVEKLCRLIEADVAVHAVNAVQSDDITMLALKFKG
jgi:phosphoserine phosphatase RsbU/P